MQNGHHLGHRLEYSVSHMDYWTIYYTTVVHITLFNKVYRYQC